MPTTEALPRPSGDPYPHGAAEALLLALDDLTAADPGGHARALLDRLAVLDPTGADPTLLRHLSDDDAAPAVLAERSLIIQAADADRVVVHRLVQRVVRDHNLHLGLLDTVLADTGDRLGAAADETGHEWASRARVADLAQHVRTLATHPAGDRTTHRVLELRTWTVYRLGRIHDTGNAIAFGESLVRDCERLLGPDDPVTLSSRNNLANDYRAAGRLDEAIALHERTLADQERVFGPDHPDTLTSRSNLANGYWAVRRLDEAIALYERTLADRERVLGADHADTLTSRNNLAIGYEVAGRMDEAITLHQRTLADRERVFGPDHPDTLTSRNNLANDYRDAGRRDEAITLHERTLADRERVLGPDHADTLKSRDNLAVARREHGSRRRRR